MVWGLLKLPQGVPEMAEMSFAAEVWENQKRWNSEMMKAPMRL